MKAVVQRVSRAKVDVAGRTVAAIGAGFVALLGVLEGDGADDARRLAGRIAHLRFFPDERGRMNVSALEGAREALVVSQFTLAADLRRGRRPSFDRAAPAELALPLCELFADELRRLGLSVETGVFGAHMALELVNDGPATFVLETSAALP